MHSMTVVVLMISMLWQSDCDGVVVTETDAQGNVLSVTLECLGSCEGPENSCEIHEAGDISICVCTMAPFSPNTCETLLVDNGEDPAVARCARLDCDEACVRDEFSWTNPEGHVFTQEECSCP